MATGILGVGARLEGLAPLADALLACACGTWVVLAGILRSRSVRSFAVVAGTAVVSADFLLAGQGQLALALWSLAAALWTAVAFTVRNEALGSLLTKRRNGVAGRARSRAGPSPRCAAPRPGDRLLGTRPRPLSAGRRAHRP